MINGLARAAGIDPARLGRYATVAEYLHHMQGVSTFTVTIEGTCSECIRFRGAGEGCSDIVHLPSDVRLRLPCACVPEVWTDTCGSVRD